MLEFVLVLLAIFLVWKLFPLLLAFLIWALAFLGTALVLFVHWLFGKRPSA